jgi:hypothetical protein
VILSGHQTWHHRTLGSIVKGVTQDLPQGDYEFDETRVYTTRCRYEFARIILDEAQVYRNPRTLVAESVLQTQRRNIHLLTATPLLNHVRDLRGPLSLIYKNSWSLEWMDQPSDMYSATFDPRNYLLPKDDAREPDRFTSLMPELTKETHELHDAVEKGCPLYILDPRTFVQVGRMDKWLPAICETMLPPIFRLLAMRMTIDTVIDPQNGQPPVRIGAQVPRCTLYTVQLGMNPDEKRLHDDMTLHLVSALFCGEGDSLGEKGIAEFAAKGGDDEAQGVMNNGIYRFLKHATLDPRLGKLTHLNHKDMTREQKKAASKKRKNNWTNVDSDHGASYFFVRTRDGSRYAVPSDRIGMAQYLAAFNVKFRYTLGLLSEWVLKGLEKVILVFEFVTTQW